MKQKFSVRLKSKNASRQRVVNKMFQRTGLTPKEVRDLVAPYLPPVPATSLL